MSVVSDPTKVLTAILCNLVVGCVHFLFCNEYRPGSINTQDQTVDAGDDLLKSGIKNNEVR